MSRRSDTAALAYAEQPPPVIAAGDMDKPRPNAGMMLEHLRFLFPKDKLNGAAEGQVEIAWSDPGKGHALTRGKLFGLHEIDEAAEWVAQVNAAGSNTYVGPGLRSPDADPNKRAKTADVIGSFVAWADADRDVEGVRARADELHLKPTMAVYTGSIPEERCQLYFEQGGLNTDLGNVRQQNEWLQHTLGTDAVADGKGLVPKGFS